MSILISTTFKFLTIQHWFTQGKNKGLLHNSSDDSLVLKHGCKPVLTQHNYKATSGMWERQDESGIDGTRNFSRKLITIEQASPTLVCQNKRGRLCHDERVQERHGGR
eukprot:647912-Hanusia_phi.AAC.3